MTVAATRSCDACEWEGPADFLERVALPDGTTALCCPECRYHAEQLAERSRARCQGCGQEVAAADLAPRELPDGRELTLCPDCHDEATEIVGSDGSDRSRGSGATAEGAGARETTQHGPTAGARGAGADTGSAASDTGPRSNGGAASRQNGGAGSSGGAAGGRSSGGATATSGGSDTSASAGSAAESGQSTASPADASATDVRQDETGGKPATTDNVCDQCGERFSIELYRVKTIDEREEEFCPDCKERAVEDGIVQDVELRRAQAYEVLEITGSASEEEIRQAYLRRVKEVHPDRSDGNRSEFMLVQEAYDRLSS